MNWAQVADDFVKIGLGALVGGAWPYFSERMKSRTEAKKGESERRHQYVREIAETVDRFHVDFMAFLRLVNVSGDLSLIDDSMLRQRAMANREHRSREGSTSFAGARKRAMDADAELTTANTLASLLAHDALSASLRSYRETVEQFWLVSGKDGSIPAEKFGSYYQAIMLSRRRLFSTLHHYAFDSPTAL